MKTYKELKEHLEDLNEVDYAGMSNVAKKGASKVLKTLAKANKAKSAVTQVADQAAKGLKNNAGKIAAAGAVAGGLALASPAVRQDIDQATDVPGVKQVKDAAVRTKDEAQNAYNVLKSTSPGVY